MKFLKQFSLVLVLVSVATGSEPTDAEEGEFRALYDEWTEYVLNGEGRLGDTIWLSSMPGRPHAHRLAKMLEQQVGFGTWLAEMVASGDYPSAPFNPSNRLYRDIQLLRFVAGIDLLHPGRQLSPQESRALDFGKVSEQNRDEFAVAWLAGRYRNPEEQVARACGEADLFNGDGAVAPWSLVAIRRFGLFGLPELAAQVRTRNSRAAFASFLIITRESDEYREYIKRPAELFVTTESKVERMQSWLARKRETAVGGDGAELFERMARALTNP